MKFTWKSCSISRLLLVVCVALVSCKKDNTSPEDDVRTEQYIESFNLPDYTTRIDENEKVIYLTGSLSFLNAYKSKPVIKVASGATISPASGEAVILTNTHYDVTGPDGSTRRYTIKTINSDNFLSWATLPLVSPEAENQFRQFLMCSRDTPDAYIDADVEGINTVYFGLLYITEDEDVSNTYFNGIGTPPGGKTNIKPLLMDFSGRDLQVYITSETGQTAQTTFRTVRTRLLTKASGRPSVPASFLSADDTHLFALYTGEIDKVSFVEQNGGIYAASVISNTTTTHGVHDVYIKANTVLPPGNYHLKVLFTDGVTATPSYIYKK